MLRVDIRDLQRGPVRTEGTLEPHDPVFEGLGLGLTEPVEVTGQLQATGDGEYLWRGHVHGVVRGECRRCLTDVLDDVDIDVDAAMFSTDPDAADDPDFYPLSDRATSVDVTEVVRRARAVARPADLLPRGGGWAAPCPSCGAALSPAPCACARSPATPV